jgi:hypothetical protein
MRSRAQRVSKDEIRATHGAHEKQPVTTTDHERVCGRPPGCHQVFCDVVGRYQGRSLRVVGKRHHVPDSLLNNLIEVRRLERR